MLVTTYGSAVTTRLRFDDGGVRQVCATRHTPPARWRAGRRAGAGARSCSADADNCGALAGRGAGPVAGAGHRDLPVGELTSANGKMMMQIFAAFAEFERNRIKERTREGLERARNEGKKLGRPEAKATTKVVQEAKQEGLSQSQAAHHLGLSIATVKRHWNK